jgi:hypothetical protein
MWEAFNEMFQLGHSLGHEKYMLDTWSVDVSRKVLTQDLEEFIDSVWEELQLAVDDYLGLGTEDWRTVDLLETIRKIISRASSRFVVGLSLCTLSLLKIVVMDSLPFFADKDETQTGRNEDYLDTVVKSIDSVVANAGATGFMPSFLRPTFGRLACWNTHSMLVALESHIKAMMEKRVSHIVANPDDESNDPIDLEQRMLRYVFKHRPLEMRSDELTRRLIMTNLALCIRAALLPPRWCAISSSRTRNTTL